MDAHGYAVRGEKMRGIQGWRSHVALALGFFLSIGFVTSSEARDHDRICARALQTAKANQRNLRQIENLRVMSYNVENFFIPPTSSFFGRMKRNFQGTPYKPLAKQQGVADMILEQDPDIVVLQEMGSEVMLEQFNQQFLGGKYRSLLLPGNDARGINIAFLVKADLNLDWELESNKDWMWEDPIEGDEKKIFSRDFPALIVREPGNEQPILVVFGKHAKSKRNRTGDRESFQWRSAQMEAAAEIIGEYRTRFGANIPMMISGDFNTEIDSGKELAPLWKLKFQDAFDLIDPPLTEEERVTHTYHPRRNVNIASQLDAILVSKGLSQGVSSAKVVRYKDAKGNEKDVPRNRRERDANPSDHMPVVVDILTSILLQSEHRVFMSEILVA